MISMQCNDSQHICSSRLNKGAQASCQILNGQITTVNDKLDVRVLPDSSVAQNWVAAQHAAAPSPAGSEPALHVVPFKNAVCNVSANW